MLALSGILSSQRTHRIGGGFAVRFIRWFDGVGCKAMSDSSRDELTAEQVRSLMATAAKLWDLIRADPGLANAAMQEFNRLLKEEREKSRND
jgi:hypothetical protein